MNDTRNQRNTSKPEMDSSGTYAAAANQSFTTSTLLNEPVPRSQTRNTTALPDMSAVSKTAPPRSGSRSNAQRSFIGDTCKWCMDHRRDHNHYTIDCGAFANATSREKWNAIDRHNLCIWCLEPQHRVKDCPKGTTPCNFCKLPHCRLLGCNPSLDTNAQHQY